MRLSNFTDVNFAYWIAAFVVTLLVSMTQVAAADKNQIDLIAGTESEDEPVSDAGPYSVENSSVLKSDRENAEALDETGTDPSNKLHLFMSEQEQYDAQQTQAAQHILQRVQSSDSDQLPAEIYPDQSEPVSLQALNETEQKDIQTPESAYSQRTDNSIHYNGVLMRGSQVLEVWVNNKRCCSSERNRGELSFNSVDPNGAIRFDHEGLSVEMHPGDILPPEILTSN